MIFSLSYIWLPVLFAAIFALFFVALAKVLIKVAGIFFRGEEQVGKSLSVMSGEVCLGRVQRGALRSIGVAANNSSVQAHNRVTNVVSPVAVDERFFRGFDGLKYLRCVTKQLADEYETMDRASFADFIVGESAPVSGRYFVFRVGGNQFAINVRQVREVVEVAQLLRNDGKVRGAISFNGEIVPVFDFGMFLDQRPMIMEASAIIVIIQVRGHSLGLLAWPDCYLADVLEGEVFPVNLFQGYIEDRFVLGVADLGRGVVNILDVTQDGFFSILIRFSPLIAEE